MTTTTDEDIELDRLWRIAFNQPLPMLGAADVARAILNQYCANGVTPGQGTIKVR